MKAPQSHIFNPYIAKILAGQDPTAMDFVQGPSRSPFTPGINPMGSNPQQAPGLGEKAGGMFGKIDSFLGKPGGMMLMNLLAQQGYSKMPQSRIGAVGRAALMTSQQQAAQQDAEAKRKLMEAQGKYYTSKADAESSGFDPTAGNVQSVHKGANGNFMVFTRGSTEPVDTGVPFDKNVEFFEQDDGSVLAFDKTTAKPLGTVVTPDQARDARTRSLQTEAAFNLPIELAGLDSALGQVDATIEKIDELEALIKPSTVGIESATRGKLPGFLGGEARSLRQQTKSLQANFGFDTLQKMRAASKTGGALGQVSERELDLLINALRSIDLEGDIDLLRTNVSAVKTHYQNYRREIENMKVAMQKQAGQSPDTARPIEDDANNDFDAKWDAAKSGTVLQAPDGTYRRKP